MLSEDQQKAIINDSGKLATLFENLHNFLRTEDVKYLEEISDIFTEQQTNLNVNLYKNIYNRWSGKV